MTVTEVVQGPDGRLYLQLRKVEDYYEKEILPEEPSRVIIIDMNDEEEDNVIHYDLK